MNHLAHPFDLDPRDDEALDLFAEELPQQVHYWSDCFSTVSSLSSAKCWACFACIGSIIGCEDDDRPKPESPEGN